MAQKKIDWKKYILLTGVLFLFPLALLLFFGKAGSHHFNTLPYYGPKTVDTTVVGDTIYHRLPDFSLTNQEGEIVTLDSLKGKVWLAAFYGTNSPYIRKITSRLLWPNFRYRHESDIYLVCFTLDAEHDTPEVLKEYVDQMEQYNDYDGKWQFLTGDQEVINEIVTDGFLIPDPTHTAKFKLVDTEGHIRGVYDGNLEEQIKDAIEDIALLKKEIDIEAYEERKRADSGN
ncbi:SCO family protein [Sanyastnella coralliicola]|uniref:SCO family protein n=1 Tax=Sanyastnella coralliicola TaxID=3069118 RepID=UPI0027B9EB54|nr:SCO family protein [Longitalea sp. SCSIO 12813]